MTRRTHKTPGTNALLDKENEFSLSDGQFSLETPGCQTYASFVSKNCQMSGSIQSTCLHKHTHTRTPTHTHTHKTPPHLVGDAHKDSEQKDVHEPVVAGGDLLRGAGVEPVRHVGESRDARREVISIRLDEVVTRDGRRVDMMLSERTYQSL